MENNTNKKFKENQLKNCKIAIINKDIDQIIEVQKLYEDKLESHLNTIDKNKECIALLASKLINAYQAEKQMKMLLEKVEKGEDIKNDKSINEK